MPSVLLSWVCVTAAPPRFTLHQVLLLEAYEQLEEDVGREVDRALSRQQEEMDRLKRRVDFLQRKLEEQDDDAEDNRAIMTELEGELKEARDRNKLYEQDVYGLPQVCNCMRSFDCKSTDPVPQLPE